VSSPADRLAAVAPFIPRYIDRCRRITSAENISQAVYLLVRQAMFDSGHLDYRQALEQIFREDPELKEAYRTS